MTGPHDPIDLAATAPRDGEARHDLRPWVIAFLVIVLGRLFSLTLITVVTSAGLAPKLPWLVSIHEPLVAWDGQWYLSIAQNGYHAYPLTKGGIGGRHDFAFFPLWPILIAGGTLGGLLPLDVSAAILANTLAVVGSLLVFGVLRAALGGRIALDALVLLSFAPAAYVLSMGYTEPLLITLVAAWFSFERRPALSGVAAFFAMLTRIAGAALMPVALYRAWRDVRPGRRDPRDRSGALFSVGAILLGFGVWWCGIWALTANPMGFMKGSPSWESRSGLATLIHGLGSGDPDVYLRYAVGVSMIVGSVVALRWHRELGLFALATTLLGVLPGGAIDSVPRYVLGAFPAFAGLAILVGRRGTIPLALAFAGAQAWLAFSAFSPLMDRLHAP